MMHAFDHEKLDVYRLELELLDWISQLIYEITRSSPPNRTELIEQLDRASLSTLLNTAEGNAKRQGRQRAKFFDDARGSAVECAACLDASVRSISYHPNGLDLGKKCSCASHRC
jgi:four helix bundle protein